MLKMVLVLIYTCICAAGANVDFSPAKKHI